MEYENLIEEACDLHLFVAKRAYKLVDNFMAKSEGRILLWLSQQENPCATDVIDQFGLSAGRVSNLLKALEEKGCIHREKNNTDRRISHITLTPAGKQKAAEVDLVLHEVYADFFRLIGPEDAKSFLAFEKKILRLTGEYPIKKAER